MSPQELREARKRRGLSQMELAKLVGVGQTAISSWETGERRPHPVILEKLVAVLSRGDGKRAR